MGMLQIRLPGITFPISILHKTVSVINCILHRLAQNEGAPMKELPAPKVSSFRNRAIRTMSIVVIPLFFSVVLFIAFTIDSQWRAVKSSLPDHVGRLLFPGGGNCPARQSILAKHDGFQPEFQSILYARTKTEVFAASRTLAKTIRPLMQANHLISVFIPTRKPLIITTPAI